MYLEDLGYTKQLESFRANNKLEDIKVGRVILEHKERYTVATEEGDIDAEITGNLRFSAKSREGFPAVGDWVALTIYGPEFSVIHKILPRVSVISRKSVSRLGDVQIIAANIDYAFLVQASGRDFNINRLERYLAICHASKVKPIIVFTKTDLLEDNQISEMKYILKQRIAEVPVFAISNKTQDGYDQLKQVFQKGKTYCLLGSSGAGKSTLVNNLTGNATMKTGDISQSSNKGRHITSHRELVVLENGGILIDNPGMREVGIADHSEGLILTFENIIAFSQKCKYSDCTHTNEDGCAVLTAIADGEIDKNSYENYLRMEREKSHFESTVAERRKKDKAFGKMVKNVKKNSKKNRY